MAGMKNREQSKDNITVEIATCVPVAYTHLDVYKRQLASCRQLWNDALSKISVSGGTEDEKHIFYTALYHTMIDPRVCSDVNGEYMGADKQLSLIHISCE